MRWKSGMTIREAVEWHPVFAWWPANVGAGNTAWLETIERRFVLVEGLDTYTRLMFGPGYWEYRARPTTKEPRDA